MTNYQIYKLSRLEWVKILTIATVICGIIAYLFYNSVWAMLLYPAIVYVVWKQTKENGKNLRIKKLSLQFLDAMRVVHTALQAGMSIENAWGEAQKEMEQLHGTKSEMYGELSEWNRALALSATAETLLSDFAERAAIEDVVSFAEVFAFAKRSGGNLSSMIEMTVEHMREKADTEAEIEVAIASRKLEQKVMNVIPMGILLYLRVTSGGYLDVLYHNWIGVLIMTASLVAYGGAVILANRIMKIEI